MMTNHLHNLEILVVLLLMSTMIKDCNIIVTAMELKTSQHLKLHKLDNLNMKAHSSSSIAIEVQNRQLRRRQKRDILKRNLISFHDIFSSSSSQANDSNELEDADADDYYKTMIGDDEMIVASNATSLSTETESPWYALSHYISPDSTLYDTIEGFLISLLFCLIVATCYSYCYYCCFTRCGLCPDDRIYNSLLNRKGRRRKRITIPRRRRQGATGDSGRNCCHRFFCCCCTKKDSYGHDGKGFFMPLSAQKDKVFDEDTNHRMSDDDADSIENSSISGDSLDSLDSALSLEYGDEHLADEYGEISDRLNDAKLENAAKDFFSREQRQSELTDEQNTKTIKTKRRINRRKAGSRCGRSRGTHKSVKSQASSILSSELESLSSYASSSSEGDDDHTLEIESAMMDLELAERKMTMKKG